MTSDGKRFRFFLDENISPGIERHLNWAFNGHDFRGARIENLQSTLDLQLFSDLRSRNFDAIITQDIRLVYVEEESVALRNNGLHWIGIKQSKVGGPAGLAALTATILTAIPHFLNDPPLQPTAYHVSPYSPKAPEIVLL